MEGVATIRVSVVDAKSDLADHNRVLAKEQLKSYYISQVLEVQVPQLQHGHDGLIFTCVESSYVPGTDEKMWARI